MRQRRVFPFRQTWYSICSRHREHDPSCDLCTTGSWSNDVSHWFGSKIYNRAPGVWRWWMNRPKRKAAWLKNIRKEE